MLTGLRFKKPIDISEEDAKLLFAMKLYEEGRVSLQNAAEISDFAVSAFIEILSRRRIPVIDYPINELKNDILNA